MRFSKVSLLISLVVFIPTLSPCQPKYSCICDAGWASPQNSSACTLDRDECSLRPAPCSALVQCFNTLGSFYCGACPTGTWARPCPARDTVRFCPPAWRSARTNPLPLPKDKKTILRRRSNPVSCPLSLTATPDHHPALTIRREVCPGCARVRHWGRVSCSLWGQTFCAAISQLDLRSKDMCSSPLFMLARYLSTWANYLLLNVSSRVQ